MPGCRALVMCPSACWAYAARAVHSKCPLGASLVVLPENPGFSQTVMSTRRKGILQTVNVCEPLIWGYAPSLSMMLQCCVTGRDVVPAAYSAIYGLGLQSESRARLASLFKLASEVECAQWCLVGGYEAGVSRPCPPLA